MRFDRSGTPKERGRPRSSEIDALVLDRVLKSLSRDGYGHLSVSAIAEELGISKPTIYLRWPSKAALAMAALGTVGNYRPLGVKLTGDTRADLIAYLKALSCSFEATRIGLTGGLWAAEPHHPELTRTYRQHFVYPTRQFVRSILQQGVQAAEFRKDADIESAVFMLVGSLYAAYIAAEDRQLDIPSIVDIALDGLRLCPKR